jgi:biopolymer transport protein ExbD
MKREKHVSKREDAPVDMTPMLDIVFIMLIFFIVTTTFSNEQGLAANRPPLNSEPTPTKTSLSISINEEGQIMMLGRIVDVARVVANTQSFLAENTTTTAAIQAHENAEHGLVVSVMDQVKKAGIENVQILVKR